MESTKPAPDDRDAAAADDTSTTTAASSLAPASTPVVLPPDDRDDGPAPPTSVALWGPSGNGKTQFAASILSDRGFAPCLYIDLDGGRPALAGYEAADLLVWRGASTPDDVVRLVREVQSGRVTNRRGERVRSVVVDAVSNLIPAEIARLNLVHSDPKDQAQKIGARFKVLWGQLRDLHKLSGVTVVQVCHSKVRSAKIGDSTVEFLVPDMFASISRPWMASVRHLWRITKTRGAKGPAYPLVMLRTEQEGKHGDPAFGEYMKTSSIAFAQWIAGEAGKREVLQWDTGTMPVHEQPTLASLLRVAEGLALEQGRLAATDSTVLRALESLQAAMDAADSSAT